MSNNNKKRKLSNIGIVCFAAVVLIFVAVLVVFIASSIKNANENIENPPNVSDETKKPQEEEEKEQNGPEYVMRGEYVLDANFSNLLLVNDKNPLPEDYDYEGNLVTVEDKYINGSLKQVNSEVWPFMKAMLEAAWEDGVDLRIWSPYRSYNTQKWLFNNQVKKQLDKGLGQEEAEIEAATVVARPGTSEHNTGLAADFNMADDNFETTKMFEWMKNNAEDYGFIMRYSAEKQAITGVIHESWHWRFVGINTAKKINDLGMCLEEYVEYLAEEEK